MARYAMIENTSGIVVNVIEWDGSEANWRAPSGYTMVEDTQFVAGPGSSYDGTAFIPVPSGELGMVATETAPAPEREVSVTKVTSKKK